MGKFEKGTLKMRQRQIEQKLKKEDDYSYHSHIERKRYMAIIVTFHTHISCFGTIYRCRNNALAPWQTPPNLMSTRKCSSCKVTLKLVKTLKLCLLYLEILSPADIRQANLSTNGGDDLSTLFLNIPRETAPSAVELAAAPRNIWLIWRVPSSLYSSSYNSLRPWWAWLAVNKEGSLKWFQQQTKTPIKVKLNLMDVVVLCGNTGNASYHISFSKY